MMKMLVVMLRDLGEAFILVTESISQLKIYWPLVLRSDGGSFQNTLYLLMNTYILLHDLSGTVYLTVSSLSTLIFQTNHIKIYPTAGTST